MAEIFKTPPDVRIGTEDNFRYYSPQTSGSYTTMKRKRSAKNQEYKGDKRRRRTAEDFLMFCKIILDHENYEQQRSQQDLRLRHSSSPLGSTGSSNESWPLSKDEYSEMYSPPHHSNVAEDLILDSEDANRSNSTEEERENSEDADDSWDQVTCYCGKPFAGRPMVECSKCLTWVHLKCAGLRRTNIPDTWHCKTCKPTLKQLNKSEKEQKSSPVSGSRKRKSTKIPTSPAVVKTEAEVPVSAVTRIGATVASAASAAASKTASKTSVNAMGTTSVKTSVSAAAISQKKIDVESVDES